MNAATLPSELKAARGSSLRAGDFAHGGKINGMLQSLDAIYDAEASARAERAFYVAG